jgi:TrpR-related protein YerC/YecD
MNWEQPEMKRLVQALVALESPKEARCFLRDLMTEGELLECAKRFQVAEMLTKRIPYATIQKETGFSSTTIARVAKWLNGKEGGYKTMIAKLHHHYNSTHTRRGLS